jgi:hypothetical protein
VFALLAGAIDASHGALNKDVAFHLGDCSKGCQNEFPRRACKIKSKRCSLTTL